MPIATTQLNLGMEAPTEPRSLLDANIRGQQLGALQRSNAETDRANREQMTLADVMNRSVDQRTGAIDHEAFARQAAVAPGLSAQTRIAAIEKAQPEIDRKYLSMAYQNPKNRNQDGTLNVRAAYAEYARHNPVKAQEYMDAFVEKAPKLLAMKWKMVREDARSVLSAPDPLKAYHVAKAASYDFGTETQYPDEIDTPEEAIAWAQQNQAYGIDEQRSIEEGVQQKGRMELEGSRQAFDAKQKALDRAADLEKARIAAASKENAPGKSAETGKPLSTEAAKAVQLIASGVSNGNKLISLLDKGDASIWATTPLGGFTNPEARNAKTMLEEMIGRLNSGGAINPDEEKRFSRMIADRAMLTTPQGRATLRNNIAEIVQRAQATGNDIYGGESWKQKYGIAPSSGTTKIGRFEVTVE